MASEDPFRVLIRRDNQFESTVTLRFNVTEGMGSLAIRTPGRGEPGLSVHFEESGLDPEALRASRFVHVVHQQRQSYALSRLTADLIGRLAPDAWVELRPLLEYGFRYLVAPEDLGTPGGQAQVQVAATQTTAPGLRTTGSARVTAEMRPKPSGRTDPEIARGEPALPRPVPMEATLAAAALDGLSREQAIHHLRAQLSVVEQLHLRVEALEKKLATSRGREKDLLGVLGKWQSQDLE